MPACNVPTLREPSYGGKKEPLQELAEGREREGREVYRGARMEKRGDHGGPTNKKKKKCALTGKGEHVATVAPWRL